MANNLETIRSVYAVLARGEVPTFLAMLAPNVSWTQAEGFPSGGTYLGPDAVLQGVFMRFAMEWDGFVAVPEEFVVQGGTVVALGEYRGTYKRTGRRFTAPFAHLWNLDGGKVVRFRQYTDTAVIERATR